MFATAHVPYRHRPGRTRPPIPPHLPQHLTAFWRAYRLAGKTDRRSRRHHGHNTPHLYRRPLACNAVAKRWCVCGPPAAHHATCLPFTRATAPTPRLPPRTPLLPATTRHRGAYCITLHPTGPALPPPARCDPPPPDCHLLPLPSHRCDRHATRHRCIPPPRPHLPATRRHPFHRARCATTTHRQAMAPLWWADRLTMAGSGRCGVLACYNLATAWVSPATPACARHRAVDLLPCQHCAFLPRSGSPPHPTQPHPTCVHCGPTTLPTTPCVLRLPPYSYHHHRLVVPFAAVAAGILPALPWSPPPSRCRTTCPCLVAYLTTRLYRYTLPYRHLTTSRHATTPRPPPALCQCPPLTWRRVCGRHCDLPPLDAVYLPAPCLARKTYACAYRGITQLAYA